MNDAAIYCKKCGTKLGNGTSAAQPEQGILCPNCGKIMSPGANFCSTCGATVGNAAPIPPPSKDFSLIGPYIHWNILPEQIAVKIDENDIAAYGRDVKGVSIQYGVKALFFFNGKLLAELDAGRYTFKDLGADEIKASKQKKDATKEEKKAEKKKLFGRFINRITSCFQGSSRERARNAGLTNRIPANVPPVSIVLVRTTDFPLVFTFKNVSTANIRSDIGLRVHCRVTDLVDFYSKNLACDRKMISLGHLGEELEPVFSKEINLFLATVSPEQIDNNADIQRRLMQHLQNSLLGVYPFLSVTNIITLTSSNAELEHLRRLREELYISEQTLAETMKRNVFLSRQEEERYRQFLRMQGIQNSGELNARQMADKQAIALAQMDAALMAAKEKIYEEMSLTEDEKAKFDMMLAAQRQLREAKSEDEVEAALLVFVKNGLLRQQEVDNLRHMITQDAKVRDLNDIQILSLATLRNQQELEQKKAEWDRQYENDQLDHQIGQERKKDGFRLEHSRTELEIDRQKREQELELEQKEMLNRIELAKQGLALRNERENAEHNRKLEMEKTQAESLREITRLYSDMTPEQIMASNPNITPEVTQAFAEKFKAEAAAAHAQSNDDKTTLLMQQLLQMKQQELDRTRADANANNDRVVDVMKSTVNAVGGMGQMNRTQPQNPTAGVCPVCHAYIEPGAAFCLKCGHKL
jgi:hypothetical protein